MSMRCIDDTPLHDLSIAVSCPYFNAPPNMYADALQSVLSDRVTVYAIGDGVELPQTDRLRRLYQDPRIVTLQNPRNRGPYFCHDVVLRASGARFFAVQDADDVSLSGRWQVALRQHTVEPLDAVYTPLRHDGHVSEVRFSPGRHVPHFALYRSASLLALGGYYGGFRVGFDTMLGRLVPTLGRAKVQSVPTYEVRGSPNSLTRSATTGRRSALRRAIAKQIELMMLSVASAERQEGRAAARERAAQIVREGAEQHWPETQALVAQLQARAA